MQVAGYKELARRSSRGIWKLSLESLDTLGIQDELEKVLNREASLVTRNYTRGEASMICILGQLKWESVTKRRKDNRKVLEVKQKHIQVTYSPR